MATVFLATDLRHGRDVAIKVIHPQISTALGADRFLREIRIAARLQYPNTRRRWESDPRSACGQRQRDR